MLGRRERGGGLRILCSKVACGVMFVDRVATKGAKRHNGGINGDAFMGRSLRQGMKIQT